MLGLAHHGRPRTGAYGGPGGRNLHHAGSPRAARHHRRRRRDRPGGGRRRPRALRRAGRRALSGPRRRRRRLGGARWGTCGLVLLDAYAGEGIPAALASEAFFRAVARRLAPGGVVAINIAEMQADGRAAARAFTARPGAVRLPADAARRQRAAVRVRRPARRRPGRHAALARRLGCARRDGFLARGAGGAAGARRGCGSWVRAAAR